MPIKPVTLCDYFLLKEVTKITGKSTNYYLSTHKDEIIVLRHARYIKRNCIEYKHRSKLTSLYNLIPLKELAEKLTLARGPLEDRYEFMKKHNNLIYFNYVEVENIVFIEIDETLKRLLEEYEPFIISIKEDYEKYCLATFYHFAGFYIGFWK